MPHRPDELTRRRFLARAGGAAIALPSLAAIVAACGKPGAAPAVGPSPTGIPLATLASPVELPVETLPQPDETVCRPTCLHAVHDYWNDNEPLPAVIRRMRRLDSGGTYAVFLGCDALRKGYRARICT